MWFWAGLVFVIFLKSTIVAHEIPNDVAIHAFLKPEGRRLRLLVRVPMSAMRDIDYSRTPEGFVDLDKVEFPLRSAAKTWISSNVELLEDENPLPDPEIVSVRAAIQSDRSIASYEEFLAHLSSAPRMNDPAFDWNQGLLDVQFEYPIQSDQSKFSIRPHFARLGIRTITILRFMPPNTPTRAFEFSGDPGLVRLDPRWHQAALQFVKMGFLHILDGTDHLLFLFCLVIPFRRLGQLLFVVTAFTVAHSFTLIASAYNLAPGALWFPPLVETLIAMSILYMALENIVGSNLHRRWIITFCFGLVHGFGFSFALRETLQFAGSYMLTSLLSFNVGVELGQLLVLVLLIPALEVLFGKIVEERMGSIILSAIAGHTAWHWMVDRANVLRQFPFEWPELSAALLATLLRWAMVVIAVAGLIWLVSVLLRSREVATGKG
jgi:HupE / UreJ protein